MYVCRYIYIYIYIYVYIYYHILYYIVLYYIHTASLTKKTGLRLRAARLARLRAACAAI